MTTLPQHRRKDGPHPAAEPSIDRLLAARLQLRWQLQQRLPCGHGLRQPNPDADPPSIS